MEEKKQKRILSDMFLREKPAKILLDMKNSQGRIYATILAKDADCTYSHTIKILNLFRKMNLVTFEKKGRIKTIKLTDSGWEIAHNLDAVARKLEEIEDAMEKGEGEKADKKAAKTKAKKRAKSASE
jgi:predicted transcriptional regulator